MVQAFNMPYILSKVNSKDDKRNIEKNLCRYLNAQLRTMPRIVDQDEGLKERFANLQKLLKIVEDLPQKVTWKEKSFVPTYRRRKA